MKISKNRMKQLISESIRKVLKESNKDDKDNNEQNEIYTKVAPFIHDDKDEPFKSGFALLEQLITMESYKIKTEEAIKEIAEDLFKKIKDNPPEGDKELENRVDELYRRMMAIQDRRGYGGKEYYAIQGMYEDLSSDYAETIVLPPVSKKCYEKLEKILKLIGADVPSLDEIYGKPSFDPFDDDEYDDYDFEKRAREGGLDPKTGLPLDFDEEETKKKTEKLLSTSRSGVNDLPTPSYEYDDDDDDFLY